MRKLIIFLLVAAVACFGQTPTPETLYGQAMNKLTGSGVSRNDLTGIDLMTKSAEQGYVPAQIALGTIYEKGIAVTAEPERAASWYSKAAANGDHLAEYLLGRMYYTGEISGGNTEAEKWLKESAQAGNPFAAYLYASSVYERDPATGLRWFREAAEQGLPQAQFRFGKALLEGRGKAVDRQNAYQWLYVAHEAGVNQAATGLNEIEGALGSTEIERVKSKARELQTRVRRANVAKGCTGWDGEFDVTPSVPPLEIQRYCE
jgi:TPR repeat protein